MGKRVASDGGEIGLRAPIGVEGFSLDWLLCEDAAEGFEGLLMSGGGEMRGGREVGEVEVVVVLESGWEKCERRDRFA